MHYSFYYNRREIDKQIQSRLNSLNGKTNQSGVGLFAY